MGYKLGTLTYNVMFSYRYCLYCGKSCLSAPRHSVHYFIPPIPKLHWTVVAGCVERGRVDLLAGLLQHLGKLLGLPDVHCILHGVAAKGVHIDCELLVGYDLHIRVNGCWWIGLVLLLNVEAHFLGDLVAVKHLHAGQHRSCHGNLVLLLVHARNVPEQFHKHLALGPVLPIPLVAVPRLESLQGGHCLVLLHLDGHLLILLSLVGQLCARPFHTWVQPHLISVKLFESGVWNFLGATVLLLCVSSRQRAEKVFDSLKLRRSQGDAGKEDEGDGDAHFEPDWSGRLEPRAPVRVFYAPFSPDHSCADTSSLQ